MKFGLFALILIALITGVNLFLRKIFNIEKEKKNLFSYAYINKLHKRIDWAIRIISIITNITIIMLVINRGYSINLFLISLILLTGIDYAVKAFFEWKYSPNPKQSILTISEMFLLVIALITIIQFNLLSTLS
ncbi:MAG: DUF4181 domain-containing protein [Bacilli bacterium]|nr:DUF4181 domain-containing protein [Bacilli bacterium]